MCQAGVITQPCHLFAPKLDCRQVCDSRQEAPIFDSGGRCKRLIGTLGASIMSNIALEVFLPDFRSEAKDEVDGGDQLGELGALREGRVVHRLVVGHLGLPLFRQADRTAFQDCPNPSVR